MPRTGWLVVLGILAVLAVCAALACALLWRALRLYRRGGTVECRLRTGEDRWRRGLAQLGATDLLWYQFASLAVRPRLRMDRTALELRGYDPRPPDPGGRPVVQLTLSDGRRTAQLRLAPSAVQALVGWSEGAPPRVRGT
ncbi:DUF2550 family protein [Georgenia sp. Z1491]|uniref:DUF2550 family protein n=1 Tax=Georgenia sp. Z1491 TaxID=3416707 RepID=UPI003CEF65F7